MKRLLCLLLCLVTFFSFSACSNSTESSIINSSYTSIESVDYDNATDFEAALNNGGNVEGKTVRFIVNEIKENSSLGFNIYAGEHLNFTSEKYDVNPGDELTVKVISCNKISLLGSWEIKYELLNRTISTDRDTSKTVSEETNNTPITTPTESAPSTQTANSDKNKPATKGSTISISSIPVFSNKPYIAINNNQPSFSSSDKTTSSYEYYSNLDSLGRCGVAVACIGKDLMPTEERGSIGQVKPTGWHTVKYDNVDGKYLYNRCHLIGFQLSGENANTKNLITGTRYLNVTGMLPFENMVADYVKETGNHVLYRVTPIFKGNNLLASGVQMEAYSVEDSGDGICFNVYCYNSQPGITINYANGESSLSGTGTTNDSKSNNSVTTPPPVVTPSNPNIQSKTQTYILNTSTKKFHKPSCRDINKMKDSNKSTFEGTRDSIISQGYSPCGHCNP